MKEITNEQIEQHIISFAKNELSTSTDLMKKYKKTIVEKSNKMRNDNNLDYIAKRIVDDMDRNLLNIEKNNFDIKQIDLSKLIDYLKSDNFPLKDILFENINNKQLEMWGWGEDIFERIETNSLVSSIVNYIHILNLVANDEKQNLSKKRDADKIKNAIDTLLKYSNDEQVKYYLQSIEVRNRAVTTKTILSCIFCNLYKSIEESYPTHKKSFILDFAKSIMYYVFDDNSDYREYESIEHINYKGYKLRKFIENKSKNI